VGTIDERTRARHAGPPPTVVSLLLRGYRKARVAGHPLYDPIVVCSIRSMVVVWCVVGTAIAAIAVRPMEIEIKEHNGPMRRGRSTATSKNTSKE
jgi:hypothetical protein